MQSAVWIAGGLPSLFSNIASSWQKHKEKSHHWWRHLVILLNSSSILRRISYRVLWISSWRLSMCQACRWLQFPKAPKGCLEPPNDHLGVSHLLGQHRCPKVTRCLTFDFAFCFLSFWPPKTLFRASNILKKWWWKQSKTVILSGRINNLAL